MNLQMSAVGVVGALFTHTVCALLPFFRTSRLPLLIFG